MRCLASSREPALVVKKGAEPFPSTDLADSVAAGLLVRSFQKNKARPLACGSKVGLNLSCTQCLLGGSVGLSKYTYTGIQSPQVCAHYYSLIKEHTLSYTRALDMVASIFRNETIMGSLGYQVCQNPASSRLLGGSWRPGKLGNTSPHSGDNWGY